MIYNISVKVILSFTLNSEVIYATYTPYKVIVSKLNYNKYIVASHELILSTFDLDLFDAQVTLVI